VRCASSDSHVVGVSGIVGGLDHIRVVVGVGVLVVLAGEIGSIGQ
jgi:hydrogenase/urease accessory protein HupE